jgi:hypothetical protein
MHELCSADGMPSSEYYYRQADLCVRMVLSASAYEERVFPYSILLWLTPPEAGSFTGL